VSPLMIAIGTAAVGAWVATIAWATDMGMAAEPGTMGLGFPAFVAMWTLMMAAMMLPAVAPLASLYARSVSGHPARLAGSAAGYLLAWSSTGAIAFGLASVFDALTEDRPDVAHGVAVAAFAGCGVYQLTPLKRWCLRHCRSPLGHLLHYAAYRGPARDLRAGLHHGLVCIGCCWMLMVALVAVGVMNVPVMVGMALLIALEKQWRHGERLAKVVGVAALVFAVAITFDAGLAPGLFDDGDEMDMDMDMEMGASPMLPHTYSPVTMAHHERHRLRQADSRPGIAGGVGSLHQHPEA
jgi:predicted metal-binding membrane protein